MVFLHACHHRSTSTTINKNCVAVAIYISISTFTNDYIALCRHIMIMFTMHGVIVTVPLLLRTLEFSLLGVTYDVYCVVWSCLRPTNISYHHQNTVVLEICSGQYMMSANLVMM